MEARKRRILLIDDDPLMREIIKTTLVKDGYDISEAGSGEEGLTRAKASRPDLILLDVMMPDLDGLEVCHRLRSFPLTVNVPVILLTALGQINEKVRGMQMGADDYITKPFDPRELGSRIEAHLRRSERDICASPLTNLPGSPIIEQVLRARLATSDPLAVLYIDLTHFKSFNDVYGWLRGDQVILLLAQQIVDTVLTAGGKDDFLGHVGGDDFVVISTPEKAEVVAKEIISRFDAAIGRLYDEDDRLRGYLQVTDRQGNLSRVPIVSVAIAIVSNDRRVLEHPSQVGDIAAEVKAYVKSLPGSCYAFDRRHK